MTVASKAQPATKHAYLYSRVSRGTQAKGTGLTRQDERGLAICKEKGWHLEPDTLSDVGSAYTGSNILKGDLGRFIQAAKDGRLKPNPVLILEQWDRFSRQDLDSSFEEARGLLKLGVEIHIGFSGGKTFSAKGLNDIATRVGMEVSMQQAWEYSHNLSKRVHDAFQRKYRLASEGRPVQLGYWQPSWIDFIGERKSVGAFKPHPVLAPVVHGIVLDYLNGKSMLQIANRLNASKTPCIGRKSKKGKRWSQGQVGYLLKSESLIGTITITEQPEPGKENEPPVKHRFHHYYPAVITDTEWQQLQTKLAENRNKKGGPREGEWISNLFPNRVKCAHCGGTVSTQNGRCGKVIQRYYKCHDARLDQAKCHVRRMLVITAVEQDFFLLFLRQHPSELIGKHTARHQAEIARLNAEIKRMDALLDRVAEDYRQYPSERLAKEMAAFEAKKAGLVTLREETNRAMLAQSKAPAAMQDIRRALALMDGDDVSHFDRAATQVIDALQSPEVRRRLVQLLPSIVDHITVDLEKGAYSITTTDQRTTGFRSVVDVPTIR